MADDAIAYPPYELGNPDMKTVAAELAQWREKRDV